MRGPLLLAVGFVLLFSSPGHSAEEMDGGLTSLKAKPVPSPAAAPQGLVFPPVSDPTRIGAPNKNLPASPPFKFPMMPVGTTGPVLQAIPPSQIKLPLQSAVANPAMPTPDPDWEKKLPPGAPLPTTAIDPSKIPRR